MYTIPRHTSITKRPPCRVAQPRLVDAITMSVKNMVPVRLAITSKDSASKSCTGASEPKKLALHGYASSRQDTVGRRPRTVYTITASGRRALAQWLADPGDGPTLEFEGLVKLVSGHSRGSGSSTWGVVPVGWRSTWCAALQVLRRWPGIRLK